MLQRIPGGESIVVKHLYRFQREISQIFTQALELTEYIRSRRDNVAADLIGLDDIEQFARAGPQQFSLRTVREYLETFNHHRYRVAARVSDPPGEHRDERRRSVPHRGGNLSDLL